VFSIKRRLEYFRTPCFDSAKNFARELQVSEVTDLQGAVNRSKRQSFGLVEVTGGDQRLHRVGLISTGNLNNLPWSRLDLAREPTTDRRFGRVGALGDPGTRFVSGDRAKELWPRNVLDHSSNDKPFIARMQ
jgi:hypothetical protein